MNWEGIANWLIDYLCETRSPREVIELLLSAGLKAEELVEMLFDADEVDDVIAENIKANNAQRRGERKNAEKVCL